MLADVSSAIGAELRRSDRSIGTLGRIQSNRVPVAVVDDQPSVLDCLEFDPRLFPHTKSELRQERSSFLAHGDEMQSRARFHSIKIYLPARSSLIR
jgi:hypothetical protein